MRTWIEDVAIILMFLVMVIVVSPFIDLPLTALQSMILICGMIRVTAFLAIPALALASVMPSVERAAGANRDIHDALFRC